MGVTVTTSVVPGILAGFAAACLTFVIRMSQPIVRRRLSGTNTRSKRVWTAAEAGYLRDCGDRRRVLRLGGVLFFGNAETLSREALQTFEAADVVILDCRGISDIDASGANIIRDLAEKSRKLGKLLLFCNLPSLYRKTIERAAGDPKTPTIFNDLEAALEWAEETALRTHGEVDRVRRRMVSWHGVPPRLQRGAVLLFRNRKWTKGVSRAKMAARENRFGAFAHSVERGDGTGDG